MLPALAILAVLTVPTLGRSLDGRLPFIVNGNDVDVVGKYPYMASYQVFGNHECGAAIISSNHLITAAHCCGGPVHPQWFKMVVGLHDLTEEQGKPETYPVKQSLRNPGYDKGTGFKEADICIFTTYVDIDMTNPYVDTIDLPAVGSTEDFFGMECIITGWGNTMIGSEGPANILQEAHTTPLTLAACQAAVADPNYIVASHICAGAAGEAGGCHGDSGSPLACQTYSDGVVLAGVFSWGTPECNPDYPSVYTRITSFRDWIKDNTGL